MLTITFILDDKNESDIFNDISDLMQKHSQTQGSYLSKFKKNKIYFSRIEIDNRNQNSVLKADFTFTHLPK